MAEKTEKKTKTTKPQPPKVTFDGRTYILIRRAGTTVTLTDNFTEFSVLAENVTAINNAARAMLK